MNITVKVSSSDVKLLVFLLQFFRTEIPRFKAIESYTRMFLSATINAWIYKLTGRVMKDIPAKTSLTFSVSEAYALMELWLMVDEHLLDPASLVLLRKITGEIHKQSLKF